MNAIGSLILAAGKGTRMQSTLPKVMHKIGGLPLLGHVANMISAAFPKAHKGVIVAPTMDIVHSYIKQFDINIDITIQCEQLGTGHAVSAARNFICQNDIILITLGDVPFVQAQTLQHMVLPLIEHSSVDIVFLAMHETQPNTYGRLIKDEHGQLQKIIEVKEASELEKQVTLCNAGFIAVRSKPLLRFLETMKPSLVSGEYYLTDIAAYAYDCGWSIKIIETSADEVKGINSQQDLSIAENFFQQQRRRQAMVNGVTLVDPQSVYFSYNTVVGKGTIIHPQVVIGPDVIIDDHVEVHSFSHLAGVHIKSKAQIGPFARIRPQTVINEKCRIGNFVEVKNSIIGESSKINHLAYIGDTTMGQYCNVGAGTITVNYDGFNKWPTSIGDKAFIGSNGTIIAPVSIGEKAIIAAGSTITKDVTKNAVAFGRSRQVELKEKAEQIRNRAQSLKDQK